MRNTENVITGLLITLCVFFLTLASFNLRNVTKHEKSGARSGQVSEVEPEP